MKKLFLLVLLTLLINGYSYGQEKSKDKIQLKELIKEFEESILQKDSLRFKKIFLDDQVQFIGIMSKKTEWSIKKDYAEFEGVAVSTCHKFIFEICQSEKKQAENFYDIIIDTDGSIATISFDYSFSAAAKMIQWGHEKWNLVKMGDEWLITDVIYSIHFPDVEEFPYLEIERK